MEDFIPALINRSLVMLIPQPPFWDWYEKIAEEGLKDYRAEDFNSYLLEDDMALWEEEMVLEEVWDFLFGMELLEYCPDEDLWPADRSYELFREWFDVKFSSMVLDLVPGPVLHEEDEEEEE